VSDITDGFGNSWPQCELGDRCGIHVVRPGHAACWCEDAKSEALARNRINADHGLTLATLCDLVLGEDADDRSDTALIRGVSRLVRGRDELVQKIRRLVTSLAQAQGEISELRHHLSPRPEAQHEIQRLRNEVARLNNQTMWVCTCGGTDCAGQKENAALRSALTFIRSTTDESGLSQAQIIETIGKCCEEVLP
jgi:predicted XRE-type DNA-binding protein